jgi:diguanylate cyclase (GGDEF)-like protein
MNPTYVSYFNITAPILILCFGGLLAACWTRLRNQSALLWIAVGLILPAIGLSVQSTMSNQDLGQWAIYIAPLHIAGAWCVGQGIAKRFHVSAHPRIALLIGVSTLLLLFYYSRIEDNLWLRTLMLNAAILFVQLLALFSSFKSARGAGAWDRLLYWSFSAFSILIICRLVPLMAVGPNLEFTALTQSPYWRFLLMSTLFFSLWFIVIVLGATISKVIESLRFERDHDILTGLLNRRAFFERSKRQIKSNDCKQSVILTCDIDHFKSVNDTYGHVIGDAVLLAVADTFRACVTKSHAIARFGGEEFVILLIGSSANDAKVLAETINRQLSNLIVSGGPQSVTASFGIAAFQGLERLDQALKMADAALYSAKENGRDQIQVALGSD